MTTAVAVFCPAVSHGFLVLRGVTFRRPNRSEHPVPGCATNHPMRCTACWPSSSPPKPASSAARSTSGSRHPEPTTTGETPFGWPPSPPAFPASRSPVKAKHDRKHVSGPKAPQTHHGRVPSEVAAKRRAGRYPSEFASNAGICDNRFGVRAAIVHLRK